MSFDNRIFNVNGELDQDGIPTLLQALKLAFILEGSRTTCKGWKVHPKYGLLLLWWADREKDVNQFPAPLSADEVFPIVLQWLNSEEAHKIPCEGSDADIDHDGHNGPGWRVFLGGDNPEDPWDAPTGSIICCVKPVYVWYGK